jgi:peroxiredoxin
MSLAEQLEAISDKLKHVPDSVRDVILKAKNDFKASYNPANAIQVGSQLPDFRLTDPFGKDVTNNDLLANGPLLITFYRGEHCPYCNLALRELQKHLGAFKAKGVTLVAISPELPSQAMTTKEKNELAFTVLSDVGNKYAEKLGILFRQPDSMRPMYAERGIDFIARNGDDSLIVPVPATILVDREGLVRNTFIDADYSKRLDPSEALDWINAL